MNHSFAVALVFSSVGLLLSGCTKNTRQPDVGMGMILPERAERIEVPKDQQFLFPSPIGANTLPSYPPELIARNLPAQTLCMEIIINTEGAVQSSTPLLDVPGCPSSQDRPDPRFYQATAAALAHWEFLAAALCKYPTGATKNEQCHGDNVIITLMPVKLAYTFTFKLVGNKPVVERNS